MAESDLIVATTAAPKIEVYQDETRANALGPDNQPRHPWSWTFRIDGQESCYWCPNEHAARRVVRRLELGRSTEAFGGSGVANGGSASPGGVLVYDRSKPKEGRGKIVKAGEVVTETVEMKSGRMKPREKRPGFLFELDGQAYETLVTASEADARKLCAITAFRTRGRLNPRRFREARAAFLEAKGKECKVHQVGRRVVAKDADGMLWLVGMFRDPAGSWDYRFKPIQEAVQEQQKGGGR